MAAAERVASAFWAAMASAEPDARGRVDGFGLKFRQVRKSPAPSKGRDLRLGGMPAGFGGWGLG